MNVFLDYCSTTPLCQSAKSAILNNLDNFANPSNIYEIGAKVKYQIEKARDNIAKLINAESDEIFFTSGASESNSWAIGKIYAADKICSNVEHSSIMKNPHVKPIIKVGHNGLVNENAFNNINLDNVLVSIIHTNNELGVINPIKNIAEFVHKNGGIFHSDITQSISHMRINVNELGLDAASFSGHKFFAPKGIGVLYVKRGIKIDPLIYGSQNRNYRGGTENTLGILAMDAALSEVVENIDEYNKKTAKLADKLKESILSIPNVYLNVLVQKYLCVPYVLNIRIDDVSGEDLVAACSEYGIYLSNGSACNSMLPNPSHVLTAIGLNREQALSSVRISLSRFTTDTEIEYACDMIPKIITMLKT